MNKGDESMQLNHIFKAKDQTIYVPTEEYRIIRYGKNIVEVQFKSKSIRFKKVISDNTRFQRYLDNPQGDFYCLDGTVRQTMNKSQIIYQLKSFLSIANIDSLLVTGRAAKVLAGRKSKTDRIKIYVNFTDSNNLEDNVGVKRYYSKKAKASVQRAGDLLIYYSKDLDFNKYRVLDETHRIFYKI